jgi:CDP-glucose 4,6-dehydratase
MFNYIYREKRVLLTGETGFKGSWMRYWLEKLGAKVQGYSLPPSTHPNHYELLFGKAFPRGCNVLDMGMLFKVVREFQPDIVFHLAANAVVAKTFDNPRETFETNLMGSVNIMEASRGCQSVKGIVMIVTDKVYESREWNYAYRENDELGGLDPYSASKVCVEHAIKCYRNSYGMNIAAARAGNVIGGGDWNYARLLADISVATSKGEKVAIHTPHATRPFQHVLDALHGYLLLGQHILEGKDVDRAWNFGPEGEMSVMEVLQVAKRVWPKIEWEIDNLPTHPHMVYLLKIDSSDSKKLLGWKPVWNMEQAVRVAINWYRAYYEHDIIVTNDDIEDYEGGMNDTM